MWNLSHSKALAVGLSLASTLSAGSIARTVALASQVEAQSALLPALGPAVAHLPPGVLPGTSLYTGPRIKGSYGVLSLHSKSGRISYTEAPPSDDPLNPADTIHGFNASKPFIAAQQGLVDPQ